MFKNRLKKNVPGHRYRYILVQAVGLDDFLKSFKFYFSSNLTGLYNQVSNLMLNCTLPKILAV